MKLSAVRPYVQWNVVLELKKIGILKYFVLAFFSLIFHLFLKL